MRATPVMAAVLAATLLWGGSVACAAMEKPSSGWFYTTTGERSAWTGSEADGLPSVPDLPLGFDLQSAPFDLTATPFVFGSASPLGSVELVDRLTSNIAVEFAYDAVPGARFDLTGWNAPYGGLFLSASGLNWPYATFGNRGIYVGTTIGMGNGLSFSLGESMLNPGQTLTAPLLPSLAPLSTPGAAFDPAWANTILAGANWQFAPWGGIGVVASHGVANNVVLGAAPIGELSLAKSASTRELGFSGRVGLGSGWITTFSYNEGVTQLDLRPGGGALASVALHSGSYGLAIAKHGLFGDDDSLGLAVSRPIELAPTRIELGGPANPDPFDGLIAEATRPILSGEMPQTDLELGYVTTFMDGALALQANAGYQMNIAGQGRNNGVTVLSRAKINF